jgi:hypothetical protein
VLLFSLKCILLTLRDDLMRNRAKAGTQTVLHVATTLIDTKAIVTLLETLQPNSRAPASLDSPASLEVP